MNKQTLLLLFDQCAKDSELFLTAKQAAKLIENSADLSIVIGHWQLSEDLLWIYSRRLKSYSVVNEHINGLRETVEMFGRYKEQFQGGYVKTMNLFVYFWTRKTGELVGCIIQAEPTQSLNATT